jgi:hypothetical protein
MTARRFALPAEIANRNLLHKGDAEHIGAD